MLDNHVKIKGRNMLLSLIKKWWIKSTDINEDN